MDGTIVARTENKRKARAMEIAAANEAHYEQGQIYHVRAHSRTGTYRVDLAQETCTCPDHARPCKHLAAASLTRQAETQALRLCDKRDCSPAQLHERITARLVGPLQDATRQHLQILQHAARRLSQADEIALIVEYRTTGAHDLPRVEGAGIIKAVVQGGHHREPKHPDRAKALAWLQASGFIPAGRTWIDPAGTVRRRRETFRKHVDTSTALPASPSTRGRSKLFKT